MGLTFQIGWNYKGKTGGHRIWYEDYHRRIKSWRYFWRRIINEVLVPYVNEQFSSEGSSSARASGAGDTSWQDLMPATVKARLKAGYGGDHPILHASGEMEDSFFGGTDHVEEITDDTLVWGSQSPHAIFHQTGTGKGYKNRRPLRGKGTGRGTAMRPILDIGENFGAHDSANPISEQMRRILIQTAKMDARRAGFAITGPGERQTLAPDVALGMGDILLGNEV